MFPRGCDNKYYSWTTLYELLPRQIKRMVSDFKNEADTMLTWEDADGDEVAIGTDEHLALALDEMPGPIYKFKARVVPGDSDDVDDDSE